MSQSEISKKNFDKRFRDNLNSSKDIFTALTILFESLLEPTYEPYINQSKRLYIEELVYVSKHLIYTLRDLLKNEALRKYIVVRMHNKTLNERLVELNNVLILKIELPFSPLKFETRLKIISRELNNCLVWIENFSQYIVEKRTTDEVIEDLQSQNSDLIFELRNYTNAAKNKSAIILYEETNKDFLKLEEKYRNYFMISIFITLLIAIGYNPLFTISENVLKLLCGISLNYLEVCTIFPKFDLYPFNSNSLIFIFFKLAVLTVGITLTTYFLRLSSFYQLKQEQAKQTKLELEAFPDYVSGMDETIANNLRQELALKYFGKEIDKTLIDKNGDLLQEQVKAGTELIKASTEMVKSVKPEGSTSDTAESESSTKHTTVRL